jgi:hypothetical protein
VPQVINILQIQTSRCTKADNRIRKSRAKETDIRRNSAHKEFQQMQECKWMKGQNPETSSLGSAKAENHVQMRFSKAIATEGTNLGKGTE